MLCETACKCVRCTSLCAAFCAVSKTGVVLRIWLIQGKEKRLLARILEILEKARKRLSRQNSTIKVRKCEEKRPEFYKKHTNFSDLIRKRQELCAENAKKFKWPPIGHH